MRSSIFPAIFIFFTSYSRGYYVDSLPRASTFCKFGELQIPACGLAKLRVRACAAQELADPLLTNNDTPDSGLISFRIF